MNQGPWGPWSGAGQSPQPKNNKPEEKNNQGKSGDAAKGAQESQNGFSKKVDNIFKKLAESNSGGGANGGDNDTKNNNSFFGKKSPKQLASLAILGAVTLWLLSGFYKINPDENGLVLYFGKFSYISTPGLNYYIPYPFGELIKKSVTTVNTEEFGYDSHETKNDKKTFAAESLMLTGDENIVDIEFQVQWQVSSIEDYTFNLAEPRMAIRKAAESAMREVIARTPISEALSDGKSKIELTARELLQQNLDLYKAGVRVVLVQLRRVDPPNQVIDAFRDVQTAKADKEKEINQAQSYANDVVPRARGLAAQMNEQAEAYKQEVVTNAQGEAERFLAVYKQYSVAKRVTKKRMYLETMEKIYRDMDKVMVDKKTAESGVMPYFPLNDIAPKIKAPTATTN